MVIRRFGNVFTASLARGCHYYYYDQLGSAYSDQPDEPSLWELPRFVEEVEQVRQALGLNHDNFYLLIRKRVKSKLPEGAAFP